MPTTPQVPLPQQQMAASMTPVIGVLPSYPGGSGMRSPALINPPVIYSAAPNAYPPTTIQSVPPGSNMYFMGPSPMVAPQMATSMTGTGYVQPSATGLVQQPPVLVPVAPQSQPPSAGGMNGNGSNTGNNQNNKQFRRREGFNRYFDN